MASYGPSLRDGYLQAGIYIARVLKGEKPGDLPVMLPTKFDLAINMGTAKALVGLVDTWRADSPSLSMARSPELPHVWKRIF